MLNYKDKKQLVMLVLILLTLVFIFVQSVLSPETSSKESDSVGNVIVDIVEDIVGTETEEDKATIDSIREFVDKNMRKVAHFIEYAVLGAEVFILLLFAFGKKKKLPLTLPFELWTLLKSLPFPVFVAFFDESIQLVSNRGPAIADMWIDICGYLMVTLIAYLIAFLVGRKSVSSKPAAQSEEQ